jgi:SAM-dependent methyltransferase
VKRVIEAMAAQPHVFDTLRWILEAGYRGEKQVLGREGLERAPSLLDLGCGTGAMAACFRREAYVGVDPNPRYIAHARRRRPGYRFEVADGRSLPFEDAAFEAVLIGGVIHHLEDPDARALLREAHRVLRPAVGRLVMWEDVPARSRWNVIGHLVHRLDEGDFIRTPEHYLEMTRATFGPRSVRHYPMASGVCDYVVIVAERRAPGSRDRNG